MFAGEEGLAGILIVALLYEIASPPDEAKAESGGSRNDNTDVKIC